jgi:predicted dinucleotide-binding enzyme
MNQQIYNFLKQLLDDAGQTDMPEEVQKQMIEDLNSRLEDKLILTALNHMPADKQDDFDQLAENKASGEEIENFIKQNVPDWEGVFSEALVEFRETYLGK